MRKKGWRTFEPSPDVATQREDIEATAAAGPLFAPDPEAEEAYRRIFSAD